MTEKSRLLSPDYLAIIAAAGSGSLVEVFSKAMDLNLSVSDLWPAFVLVGLVWVKETARDLIVEWRTADPAIIHQAAEQGAQTVIDRLRTEKEKP